MSRLWFRAVVISALVSLAFVLASVIIFSSGRSFADVDWGRVNEMNYREAQAYIDKHTKVLSAWDSLVEIYMRGGHWDLLLYTWLSSFALGLTCCGVLLWWLRRGEAPSNTTPHADARDVPASANDSGARAGGRER